MESKQQVVKDDRPRAYVTGPRADGKFAVQFVYLGNGTRLNKLLTRERLDAIISGQKYWVIGAR